MEPRDRRPLPYSRQLIDEADVAAVVGALKSDYLTTGPKVAEFEDALARFTGARHAVVLSSGTAALHAAYAAAGIGPGDEVITSPLTFSATANAAMHLGARPVFVDTDPQTGLLDPVSAEAAVTSKTKAIVAIDYAGHPAQYDELRDVAGRQGLTLLADAAHSLGAEYKGRPVGTLADQTILSFHPVKAITTGEGGAVLTAGRQLDGYLREFRSHGITRDSARFGATPGGWYYEVQSLGFNYRLSDIHAALGISQLVKIGSFLARRRAIASTYAAALAEVPEISLPVVASSVDPAWHLFVIHARSGEAARRELYDRLHARGLGVQVHYVPVHVHPIYRELGYRQGQFPNAEAFYASALSIPLFPAMTDNDVQRVIEDVSEAALGL